MIEPPLAPSDGAPPQQAAVASTVQQLLRLLPVLISLGLLYWFSRTIELDRFVAAFHRIPLYTIPLLVLTAGAATVFQGLRFSLLGPPGLSHTRHVLLCFALSAGNILLPFRGGELIRPLYLRRWLSDLPLRAIVLWSVIDKLLEALCLMPFAVALFVIYAQDPRFLPVRRHAVPALIVAGLGLCAAGLRWLRRQRDFKLAIGDHRISTRSLVQSVALSLLVWVANYAIFFIVVPDARVALALLIAVNASLLLPGLPAGVGTYEAAFVWVGQLSGATLESLLLAAVVSHAVQIIVTLAIGLPVLSVWGWPRRQTPGIEPAVETQTPSDISTQ